MEETATGSENDLHPEVEAAVHNLRGGLTAMLCSVGVDVSKPQQLARRLSMDKALAWKISRVALAGRPDAALQYLPGDAAMSIMLKALTKAGVSLELRRNTSDAIDRLRDAVLRHLGDKPTLELVIDAMPGRKEDRLMVSRKLAFRGNSGIWGVQARARLQTALIAPNAADPQRIDGGVLRAWVGFRRLRQDAEWVLFRTSSHTTHVETVPPEEALDDSSDVRGPMFLRGFCSASMPEVHLVEEDGQLVYELGQSVVGSGGAFDCVLGSITRAIGSRFAMREGDTGTFAAQVSAPTEKMQFDVLVHRDLSPLLSHSFQVVGGLIDSSATVFDRDVLPIHVTRVELGSCPPVLDSVLFPRYRELAELAVRRMGWRNEDFIGVRYEVDFPPYPSTMRLTIPLEPRK